MEHIGCAGFKMEGILGLIKYLLILLHIERLLLDEYCAFDTKGIDKMANFLAGAY